jgi:hypothetical protein
MRDFLTDLDYCFPRVFGISLGAVGTLLICYNEFAFKRLLEDSGCKCFFLDCELNFDSP